MSRARRFDPTILREYDISGVVGRTHGIKDAEAIGCAFATIAARDTGGKTFCVGYDGRVSSPDMEAALVAGLNSAGADTIRVGQGPTPMLYYSVHEYDADGGIMVTGSHNPPDNNGFKIMLGKESFFGERIQNLGALAASGDFHTGLGKTQTESTLDRYVDRLAKEGTSLAPLKVAWDAGNGAAGEAMAKLTNNLPGEHLLLNEEINGTFPVHHPDPTDPIGNCVLFVVIDPSVFAGLGHFTEQALQAEAYVRGVPLIQGVDGITLPGDPERQVLATRQRNGIPLDEGNWTALMDLAAEFGVATPE